ncbi:MAG: hypothetical protein LBT46_03755 [Planctomycetaceae bacterium]|nr:hypothetical protein [Planctomycetaceae bacterium]
MPKGGLFFHSAVTPLVLKERNTGETVRTLPVCSPHMPVPLPQKLPPI